MDDRTADILLEYGHITLAQLDEAAALQKAWAMSLPDILAAKGYITPRETANALARQFDLRSIDLLTDQPDAALLEADHIQQYINDKILPWRREGGKLTVVTTSPDSATLLKINARYGKDARIAVTTRFDIDWTLQQIFGAQFTQTALNALYDADPQNSANPTFTRSQRYTAAGFILFIVLGIALFPTPTLILLSFLTGLFFIGNFFFKALLIWLGGRDKHTDKIIAAQVADMKDCDLPVYSILVPMFRDAHVLPILVNALRNLDYPAAKLDIKLVLEADDHETINAARDMGLESIFEIIRVPPSMPQTKPKACNYALPFARGEYLVIYDAEDKPEPDQLKKVLLTFQRADEKLVCIQARLNYFNVRENWLTRMFTLDYSLWFDLMLPGLEQLRMPIPLGGTSNHFKIKVLRELNAWDPYNVTEDADLGVRITQKGYRTGIVNSTTFEEANCAIPNWIRQRSRWLKGYMQTWLVHMRNPVALYKSLGFVGFFGFQFFVGGTIAAALLNPIFWLLYAMWLILPSLDLNAYFPPVIFYMCLFNLLVGNLIFIYLCMTAPIKRKNYDLVPYGLTIFFYWVLQSIAGYKGLWQLIFKPFYWEKTDHGISKQSQDEIAMAQMKEAA